MSKHIRTFSRFQEIKKAFENKNIKEAVVQIDDVYKVGGIEVLQTTINSYVKKVKTETGKNLRQMFSDMEIADQLVRYVASNRLDVDKIPSSALLGGDKQIVDEVDTDDLEGTEVTTDTTEVPVSDEDLEASEDEVTSDQVQDETSEEETTLPTDETSTDDEFQTTETPENEEEPKSEENSDEETEEEEEEGNEDVESEKKEEEEEEGNEDLPI